MDQVRKSIQRCSCRLEGSYPSGISIGRETIDQVTSDQDRIHTPTLPHPPRIGINHFDQRYGWDELSAARRMSWTDELDV